MKAITLWQPWATLMAIGAKQIETRSWSTAYRGPLVIHAAKGFPNRDEEYGARMFCASEPCLSALRAFGYASFDDLPKGAAVAVCQLDGIAKTEDLIEQISEQEAAFGNYEPRRFGWMTSNGWLLRPVIHCSGMQGLWEPSPGMAAHLRKVIGR